MLPEQVNGQLATQSEQVPLTRSDAIRPAYRHTLRLSATQMATVRMEGAIEPSEVARSQFPLALVLGNEVMGVPADVLDAVDLVVGLPQYGIKASLNVSVAFGVAAYGLVHRVRSFA